MRPLPTRRHGVPSGWCAAVVDLAGREPAIGHGQGAAMPDGLVGQLRLDQTHRGIGDRRAGKPGAPCPVSSRPHRGLRHDVAVGARQLRGELVGSFPPQMHAPAIQPGQLGFRCPVTARSGDTAGKFTTSPAPRRKGGFQRGRILIFDNGFGAGGGVDGGDRGQRAHPEIHTGAHRRLGGRA